MRTDQVIEKAQKWNHQIQSFQVSYQYLTVAKLQNIKHRLQPRGADQRLSVRTNELKGTKANPFWLSPELLGTNSMDDLKLQQFFRQ